MRPTRGLGSAPLPRTGCPARVAPSYLALLRVELARFTRPAGRCRPPAGSSLWRWSSPHGGRVLPAGRVETALDHLVAELASQYVIGDITLAQTIIVEQAAELALTKPLEDAGITIVRA